MTLTPGPTSTCPACLTMRRASYCLLAIALAGLAACVAALAVTG